METPVCPICKRKSAWATEFGTGRQVPMVCEDCDDFGIRQLEALAEFRDENVQEMFDPQS